MDFLSILLIAVGLAMDAFAVSISCGLTMDKLRTRHVLRIAFCFGLFQALMPLAGWVLGIYFKNFIASIDHWVAFVLLAFVGGHMIWETREGCKKRQNPLDWHVLLLLSVATSIDAFAVGLTFAFLDVAVATPVAIIGCVTFILSYVGVHIGDKVGCYFEKKVEWLGGLILIGIGLKILIEHLIKGT